MVLALRSDGTKWPAGENVDRWKKLEIEKRLASDLSSAEQRLRARADEQAQKAWKLALDRWTEFVRSGKVPPDLVV